MKLFRVYDFIFYDWHDPYFSELKRLILSKIYLVQIEDTTLMVFGSKNMSLTKERKDLLK